MSSVQPTLLPTGVMVSCGACAFARARVCKVACARLHRSATRSLLDYFAVQKRSSVRGRNEREAYSESGTPCRVPRYLCPDPVRDGRRRDGGAVPDEKCQRNYSWGLYQHHIGLG